MKYRLPSRQDIEQEIARRQARFAPQRESAALELIRGKDPSRTALTPEAKAKIAEPLEQFWQARRSRFSPHAKHVPHNEYVTLPQAAEDLGVSEKTVWRLIVAKTIPAQKIPFQGKQRWGIKRANLNRYRALEWLGRQSPGAFAFAPQQGVRGIPLFSLSVSLEEFWRWVCKPVGSSRDYATRKDEIRKRLPGNPQDFVVRLQLDPQKVWPTLDGIVRSVRIPKKQRGKDAHDLQQEAVLHLLKYTVPKLRHIRFGWRAYFRQSVRNFYLDQIRQEKTQHRTEREWTLLINQ